MRPTYHIVSHTHWDREWYKTFEQFRSMLVPMIDDLIALLYRDPDFVCFTLDGQTVLLEDYLAVRPERENDLRRLAKAGRLFIGPWYILPDEFLVSAEATVRNLLIGTRMAKAFGGFMNVGYIPDSFGHIAMMPAILNGFDITAALVYRGFGGEPGQTTSEYWWKSPDGTRCLLVHLSSNGYSAGYFHQGNEREIVERFKVLKSELDVRATTSHRLLMNGGDHHWPDPNLPQTMKLLRQHFDGDFIHSAVPRYVDAVRKEVNKIPEVEGELRFGYRYAFAVMGGVYSSRIPIKQRNWRCQNLLQRYVEPLSAFAATEGMRSQKPLVDHAWRTLLKNHPHDSICGCSIDRVHREMMTRFAAVEDIGASVIDSCLEYLIPGDDRSAGDDCRLFVFNPSPVARSEITAAPLNFHLQDVLVGLNPDVKVAPKLSPVSGFVLRDANGQEVPYQVLDREEGYDITFTKYNYPKQTYADKFSLLVDVKDAPPVGFKGFRVEKRERFPHYATGLKAGRNFLENEYCRVEVNQRGELTLLDKISKRRYTRLNVFEDSGDVGDEYNYSYPARDTWSYSNRCKARVILTEKGPLRAALRVQLTMVIPASSAPDRKSRSKTAARMPITTTVFLTSSSRSVTIETTIDNTAKDHRFRVLFPTGIATDTVHADSQFCILPRRQQKYNLRDFTIEHPASVAPMQRFVMVRDAMHGFVLFSDGLPEYELKPDGKGVLALTLLRCIGQLAGENLITRPGGKAGWHNETPDAQCPGKQTFRYAILTCGDDQSEAYDLINEEAERFQLPLLPFRRKNADEMKLRGSMVELGSSRPVFSALKLAEIGDGIIMRIYNPLMSPIAERVRFTRSVKSAWIAKLNEETIERVGVEENCEIPLKLGPGAVLTLRVQFGDGTPYSEAV